jgi:hypothetical protein
LKPADREVVCHASAWDIDYEKDVRLKMCIQINEEDFSVVHHELGHNYYQMAYRRKPFPVPRERERRVSRSHRRHDRAVSHSALSETAWLDRQGAGPKARISGSC